ncbi:MAG: HypC/HybG/HupF family hydrogenase formation chaperone [Ilumatobacteraceae bacterium]|nr:HypC/HybG/HupF family hydrogenase formation chaperone [Acidimicrobiales bacterium]MCB9393539.1 HypC/HybG/HupF family hydrogenase formation chaperone [Acidimicrobiaceae bacterium]
MCLGVPGKVIEVREQHGTRMATVDFGGVTKDVCLAYVPDVGVGDYTIVHAGFAITRLDEASALETLRMFADLGLLDDELDPAFGLGGHGAEPR